MRFIVCLCVCETSFFLKLRRFFFFVFALYTATTFCHNCRSNEFELYYRRRRRRV